MAAGDGLLEHRVLLIGPLDASGQRPIRDVGAEMELGLVRRRPRHRWTQLGPRPVEVCESLDASLLFTVRRCWSLYPWYEVDDAEGSLVGWSGGSVLLNTFGHMVATREDGPQPGMSRFKGPDVNELAQIAWEGDDVQLSFAEPVADLPFVKMLLLAAALRWR
jgi:hypothetical protein